MTGFVRVLGAAGTLAVLTLQSSGLTTPNEGFQLLSRQDLPFGAVLERRQGLPPSNTPPRCRPLCDSVRTTIAEGCRPASCCNQPFVNGYVDCYKCFAEELGVDDHRPAKNVIQNIVDQCTARTGTTLEIPFLPDSGPVTAPGVPSSTASSPASSSASQTPSSSIPFPSSSQSSVRPTSSASISSAPPISQTTVRAPTFSSSESAVTSATSDGAAPEPTEEGSAMQLLKTPSLAFAGFVALNLLA